MMISYDLIQSIDALARGLRSFYIFSTTSLIPLTNKYKAIETDIDVEYTHQKINPVLS